MGFPGLVLPKPGALVRKLHRTPERTGVCVRGSLSLTLILGHAILGHTTRQLQAQPHSLSINGVGSHFPEPQAWGWG